MKNKTTAAILAFFLGGIGVHRFYLGQTGLGILYLLFSWTFIPFLIAFIDFICFLVMSDDAFNKKYNLNYYLVNNQQTPNNVNTMTINMGTQQSASSCSEEIQKLYDLKEKGIITQEEFEAKKKALL